MNAERARQLMDPARHTPASRDDELTAGVVLELSCGHVLHGPNELTVAWLFAKHDAEENEGIEWEPLSTGQKCERLALALDHLASEESA
jgi:hypothetical protein